MTSIWNVYSYPFVASDYEFNIERFSFLLLLFGLVVPWSSFFLGGVTVAALESEADVNGNREEAPDVVAKFPARLSSRRRRKTMLLVLPL